MLRRLLDRYVHYGPPYNAEYGGCLYEECNHPRPSLLDIHFLLSEGGDPRVGNKDGNAPLHFASRYGNLWLCKMLVKAGAHPQGVNHLGQSALSIAVIFNQKKIIPLLIEYGADVYHVD